MLTATAAAALLSACAPETLVILDPILSATANADGGLSRDLRRVGREHNRRVAVVPVAELSTVALVHALETNAAPEVLVPALFGTVALQVADDYPQRHFYLVGRDAAPRRANATAVAYERTAAFETAGRVAARFAVTRPGGGPGAAGAPAQLTVLFLVDSPRRAAELAALRAAADREFAALGLSEAEVRFRVEQYSDPPGGDALRTVLSPGRNRADDQDDALYAFFLGSANHTAWEVIGSRAVNIITEWLPPQTGDRRVVGWVAHSWTDALDAVLEASDGRRRAVLEVPARFIRGPVLSGDHRSSVVEQVKSLARAADAGK
ncbi:MAG: hypothetical protein EA384_04740 [Spirochaetaceae bacterium]|nr:MAG: hypothetical protein EA384_04740 [Spirochaetaceae bacterium]